MVYDQTTDSALIAAAAALLAARRLQGIPDNFQEVAAEISNDDLQLEKILYLTDKISLLADSITSWLLLLES
jgi:hypothetical protein